MQTMVARLTALLITSAALSAAIAAAPGAGVPAGPAMVRPALVTVFLRHDRPGPEAEKALAELVHARFPDVTLVKGPGNQGAAAGPIGFGVSLPPEKQPLPQSDVLDYTARRLTPEQRTALRGAKSVLVLTFSIDPARRTDLASVCSLSHALALKLGAILEDGDSREVFTPELWKSARLDSWQGAIPAVPGHINIHTWKDAKTAGVDTVGLARFGLPELGIVGIAPKDAAPAAATMVFVAQQLVERPVIDKAGELTVRAGSLLHATIRVKPEPGTPGVARVALTVAPGTGATRRWLISPLPTDADTSTMLARVMRDLIGRKDTAELSPEGDAELAAASKRAQGRIAQIKALWRKGAPAEAELFVKAPFPTPAGGREWMWVEVRKWDADKVTGALLNAPTEVPGVAEGETVAVSDSELFDYRLELKGQPPEGGETDRILESRATK